MNQKLIFYIFDAFKTMNRNIKRMLLSRDTGYYAQNLRYDDEYGSLSKRLSRAKYNTVSVGTSEINSLFRYYKNSTASAVLIAGFNGSLTRGYDGMSTFSNIKTGLNASNDFSFITYKDLCYMFNGTDPNMVFTFTDATGTVGNMGIASSGISPTAILSATVGNLDGAVNYAITAQYDGYQEGNVSPSSPQLDVNNSRSLVSLPTLTDTRTTGRYLYRTKSNASTLYRLAVISDNTTLTYMDNIADTSLDITRTAPINYEMPATYKYVCLHDDRLFLAWNASFKSRIIYSDIRNGLSYPDVFPSGNYLDMRKDDGDEITAILNDHLGQLVVFKENSVCVISTPTASDLTWSISDPYSIQGCVAPRSAVVIPGGILYITRFGEQKRRLVLWTGQGVKVISELEGIEPYLTDIPENGIDEVKGHYHGGTYYLAFRNDGTYNDKVLLINTLTWSCEIDKKNVAAFCSWNGGNDFGELYTGTSDNTGLVYREDTSTYDFMIKRQSELDAGTHSQTQSTGAEETPSLMLTSAIADDVGARTWASMTGTNDTWATRSAYNDTWFLSGQWMSQVYDISARAMSTLLWHENNPGESDVLLWIRTGDTQVACQAADWQGPYTNPSGSDLSGATVGKYIQILVKLFVKYYANYPGVSAYRLGTTESDYIIKVSANYGEPAEATIEMEWQSGRIDLGDINEVAKRMRKRLRSVKVEYEAEDASTSGGNFDFQWFIDGATSYTGTFNTSFAGYPSTRTYQFPMTNFFKDFSYRLYTNSDVKGLKIRRVLFTVSLQPYYVLK